MKAEQAKSSNKRKLVYRSVGFEESQMARIQAVAEYKGTDVTSQIQMAVSERLDRVEAEIEQLRAKGAEPLGLCSSGK